ncbi:MAG: hypothetical protein E7383_00540 [Ruminococcaceae bacterium]|nr:hypothetical protein [Oscillospiraceae bacterium]
MPYCAKCGSLIDDQDMFCKKCGNPVNNQIIANTSVEVSPIALQEKTRSEALVEMKRMIAYFSQKQDLYDEYDECVESINHYSNPRSRVIVPGQSSSSPLFIGAIALYILSFFFMLFAIIAGATENGGGAVALWILTFVFVAIAITCFINGIVRSSKNRRETNEYRQTLLNESEEEFARISNELSEYYQNYGYCPVAASYTNPKILSLILEPINLGRADTIKEAINVIIQDSHNSEMELQAQIAAQAAESAARSSKATAFFTAGTFINTLRR